MQFTQKSSPTKIAISQLPDILEGFITAQIEGCPLFINDYLRSLFYIGSRKIQINTNFAQIRQKRQYNLKTTIFGRSSPKSIGFFRKHIRITMQNFRAIGATFFELSRDKKLTTHTHTHTRAHTHTRTHTHTYIFGRRLFFQCRSYINKGNGEI